MDILADGVKHFKEEGGRERMCEAVERYAEKKAEEAAVKAEIEAGIAYNVSKERILARVQEVCGINKSEAEKLYNISAGAAI